MALLGILGTLTTTISGVLSALLKDTSVVLILLGASIGFHFGDQYGRWRQTKVDAVAVQHGGSVQPDRPVRPIRDLIHFVVGDPPDSEEDGE